MHGHGPAGAGAMGGYLTSHCNTVECRRWRRRRLRLRLRLRSPFGMSAIIAALTGKEKGGPAAEWIRAHNSRGQRAFCPPSSYVCLHACAVCVVRINLCYAFPIASTVRHVFPIGASSRCLGPWSWVFRLCARAAAAKATSSWRATRWPHGAAPPPPGPKTPNLTS